MALGGLTKGVTPLELASAYGVFANSGTYVAPTAIVKIVDRNGKVLEQHAVQEKNVISAKSAYILTDILRGVITRGTGTGANIGRPAAGKTGTTSDYKDAWFVGYTPDLVTSVWIGNDNADPLRGMTGADKPADIWKLFMNKALSGVPSKDFIKPAGVIIDDTPTTLEDDKETDKDKDAKDKDKDKDKLKDAKDKNKSKLPDKKEKPASTDSKTIDSKQSEQPAILTPVAPTAPSVTPAPEQNKN
jgi:penicillin-binding protein 1A